MAKALSREEFIAQIEALLFRAPILYVFISPAEDGTVTILSNTGTAEAPDIDFVRAILERSMEGLTQPTTVITKDFEH